MADQQGLKALIVGGGIGGLTASLCLAKGGHEAVVFEQAEAFAEIGAGIQLSPNATRVLHDLGLEDALRAAAFLPQATQFRHWRTGRVIAQSPLGEAVVARYGEPYYHIHRGDLLRILVAAAEQAPGVELRPGARVEGIEEEGIEEEAGRVGLTANGETLRGDLLVGADGIHSLVRDELWGDAVPRFTGNVAWRALVPAAQLPEGLVRPMSTVWWGPHRHFVHYYVRGGELVNCVCVVEKSGWEVESWTEPGDYEELESEFAGWHGDIQQLIGHVERGSLYKWALFDRPPMARWGRGRVTLLGDACHPTLPFMAQGAAMAIEDAAVLAGSLARDADVGAALARYEDLRRARTARIQNGSRRNATVFHLSGVKAWLRNRAARAAGGRAMDGLFRYDALAAVSSDAVSPRSRSSPAAQNDND
jgi:salicylate hydroxylase